MSEALGHREQERDDAERLLAMLRVTLAERSDEALNEAHAHRGDLAHEWYWRGRCSAFSLALSLLGPEETYLDDGTEPF